MKQNTFLGTLCALLFMLTFSPVWGQTKPPKTDPTTPTTKENAAKTVIVDMVDGIRLQGKLLERRGDTVVLETVTFGVMNLNIKNIKKISAAETEQIHGKEFWFENPHASRGFFAPTGFGLRKGEGYYQNTYLYFQSVGYGFTDNFTVGVTADIIGPITGNVPFILYVTPKFNFKGGDNFNYGVGALIGSFGFGNLGNGDNLRTSAGLLYGVGTWGSRDKNITVGLGYGYTDGALSNRPTLTLSGTTRIARKWCLMMDNFYFGGGTVRGMSIYGARLMGEKFAFDFGFLSPWWSSTANIPLRAIPYYGVSFPFGRKKL